MCSPANTVTGRRHATTGTGQGDLVICDVVGMSDCAAPNGEVTGEGLENKRSCPCRGAIPWCV